MEATWMSMDRRMDKEDGVHIYTMECYSVIKKKEIMTCTAMWMGLEIIILSKSDGERQIIYDFTYIWNLKKRYKWTYLQNRNRHTDLENKLMVTKGDSGDGGRDKLGIWD